MAPHGSLVKRIETPLTPITSVLTVLDDDVVEFDPSEVTPLSVGLKAYGLASLPPVWTKPFFVVPHNSIPTAAAVQIALTRLGVAPSSKLIVRSSGVDESMESRGELESEECEVATLSTKLQSLQKLLAKRVGADGRQVHWVVQELLPALAKGHLSNERRIAEDKRDWVAEVEASASHAVEAKPISLRTWRDSRLPSESVLKCLYRAQYTQCLATVARWAYERLIRVHFEWVWDGHTVYIVQADACDQVVGGSVPKDLVQKPIKARKTANQLRVFRAVTDDDYVKYRKLGNSRLYRGLGYDMNSFYVLDDKDEIRRIIEERTCSEDLRHDLELLVARPLVIRTDGLHLPDELKQMLPRSEELRSISEAERWILEDFRQQSMQTTSNDGVPLTSYEQCLIAHHFVPATAAAWCQAKPDQRRVRIESLWGLPEGLYWYAYDAFDVDTQVSIIQDGIEQPKTMKIHERRRYKERFVAPNSDGQWVLHKTATGFDWQRSIKRTEWIEEIAWTSRKIAAAVGHPVVVMWFVDVPKFASQHRVLPWYHEEWKAGAAPHKAAPRRKLSISADFVLSSRADWDSLKAKVNDGEQIVRICVKPNEPDIVRDRDFAKELAQFAKKYQIVVELEGGVLSHAYYMLAREGCVVECADLDDYVTNEYALEFNKLVRDKIPSSISAKGEAVKVIRLEGEALIAALRRKLVEEALEVLDSKTAEEMAEELADVREVVLSLMERLSISETEIETRRKKKAESRGGFKDALMLSKTTVAPSLGFHELQTESETERLSISATIDQEAAIPSAYEELHTDKHLDEAGVEERLFTIDLPAHASGYRPARVLFRMPTSSGEQHDMVFELHLTRRGADLRVRARVLNTAEQLEFNFGGNASAQPELTKKKRKG